MFCLIQGCDGSVLVNSTSNNHAEKEAAPNLTLRGFDFIDRVKSLLEAECPGIVSCADTLALVARDSIVATVRILQNKSEQIKPTYIFLFYEQINGFIIYLFYVMFCRPQGGPFWSVPTGRRDGTISNSSEALADIPPPTSNFTTLQTLFANNGLDLTDLVLLSGKLNIIISSHLLDILN
jgi:peroxidase